MIKKSFNYGMILAEILLSIAISAFIMYAISILLFSVLIHRQYYNDVFNEWQKRARLLSTIESRIVNAGLGVPSGENIENVFRFTPTGTTVLPGWTDVLEILTSNDIPAPFQVVSGESIARGERMRVLSTFIIASETRIIPASAEWGPHETRTVNLRKPLNRFFSYPFIPGELSSFVTTPSFGRPVIIKNITAPYDSATGSVELQNSLFASKDWYGVDMFHSFRISYFHVEAQTLYIRDSDKKDTTNAFPAVSLHREPVVDDVLSVCFEFNKTTKTLSGWFLIRSRSPSIKPGIPNGWPAWATAQPSVSSNKLKVISYSWRLRNI